MTQTLGPPLETGSGDLDLDISIVESGDAVNVLLSITDDGCDTVGGSDC
jgi:FxLD family lantipeptide